MPDARDDAGRRFLTLADVAEILATSVAQVRALVQSGELRYIQIGGRQQYRIETVELEKYIQRMYAESDGKKDRQPPARDWAGSPRAQRGDRRERDPLDRPVDRAHLREVPADPAQHDPRDLTVRAVQRALQPGLRETAQRRDDPEPRRQRAGRHVHGRVGESP